ncbi:hypothetical protein [Sphingomonas sp. ID0503]|uniref:hypothetical protein n=1 Tax=Sphingomonas sp. ID0503 TaxID=3399691 RepID=UPI003AFACDAD
MSATARIICIGVIVFLTAFVLYAFATGDVIADQLYVWQRAWGVFVWADVYCGFLLFALIVYAFERRLGFTIGLFILTCAMGNIVPAAWLLWRGPELFKRIGGVRA